MGTPANYCNPEPPCQDELRLEAVTVCVGFDDMLDVTLGLNHCHVDTLIVVTAHDDRRTQRVAKKHGAVCVLTDLFKKNGRNFNKGAAINAGFGRFQYNGWRMHLDSDIALPDNFRRVLFNHTHLDKSAIYGCDRVDVIGRAELNAVRNGGPQNCHSFWTQPGHTRPVGHRYVDPLYGYIPIGFFQLWHASCQKPYPFSLGTAAHDDTMFAAQWPADYRRHLPTAFVYHLCSQQPTLGENWDGNRKHPRLK
jgi:hypothetical protein